MPTFAESLEIGKKVEELVLEWVRKKYPSAFLLKGYCKQMDLFIPEKNESVEVKSDKKSDHTGNFVVEVSFGGKPSGISTSKANWWCFLDSTNMYWITPQAIKDCIVHNGFRLVEFVGPNDPCAKKSYLVPKSILQEYVSFVIPYQ